MNQEIRIVALFGARVFFGQERANLETLARLREQGCAVLCVVRDEDWPGLATIREAMAKRGLEVVMLPHVDYPIRGWILHAVLRNPRVFFRSNRALPHIVKDFRATHIHAFNPLYVAGFCWALAKIRLPLVYRSGDRPTLHNAFYRWAWSFVKKRTTHFVAGSRFIAGEIVATGVEPDRISVIYAAAPARFDATRVSLPGETLGGGACRFVYVGQINESKGVGVLVDAFERVMKHHSNAHLLIAGPIITEWRGDDWARALRERIRSDARISRNVHFLGFIENAPELMAQCHVHVAPSFVLEGYGLVVVEAKQAGRPSIIFKSGGMSELVTDGVDGFALSEKNATALAEAMEKYASDPRLGRVHGEAASASIATLGIPDFAKRWCEVYLGYRSGGNFR